MPSLTIVLTDEEYTNLDLLARSERRSPREQAAYIVAYVAKDFMLGTSDDTVAPLPVWGETLTAHALDTNAIAAQISERLAFFVKGAESFSLEDVTSGRFSSEGSKFSPPSGHTISLDPPTEIPEQDAAEKIAIEARRWAESIGVPVEDLSVQLYYNHTDASYVNQVQKQKIGE